jgi:hypothetical protein
MVFSPANVAQTGPPVVFFSRGSGNPGFASSQAEAKLDFRIRGHDGVNAELVKFPITN